MASRSRRRLRQASEAAFVFPAARGRMRLALTPARVIATSAAGTVELRSGSALSSPGVEILSPCPAAPRADADVWACRGHRQPGQGSRQQNTLLTRLRRHRPRGRGWGRSGKLNRRATPYEVSFKADAFAGEAEDVVSAIKRYQRDARRRRAIGSAEEHARLLRELGEATPARA